MKLRYIYRRYAFLYPPRPPFLSPFLSPPRVVRVEIYADTYEFREVTSHTSNDTTVVEITTFIGAQQNEIHGLGSALLAAGHPRDVQGRPERSRRDIRRVGDR